MDSSSKARELDAQQKYVICSQHFVTGKKSNNPLAPNYLPSIFPYTASPIKRKFVGDATRFELPN